MKFLNVLNRVNNWNSVFFLLRRTRWWILMRKNLMKSLSSQIWFVFQMMMMPSWPVSNKLMLNTRDYIISMNSKKTLNLITKRAIVMHLSAEIMKFPPVISNDNQQHWIQLTLINQQVETWCNGWWNNVALVMKFWQSYNHSK